MKKFTLKAFTANTNANGFDNSIALYIEHPHKYAIAEFIVGEGVNTIKQFLNTDFSFCGELSTSKQEAIIQLQKRLKRMMKGKSTAVKVKAKKVVAKKVKAVAKKKSAKQTIQDKYTKLYKVVNRYSENLMQDIYDVVYRGNVLKTFVNENLASKYIGQEVLVKVGEHNIRTAKKSRALNAELAAEFE